jgi:ADP-sugar diphosphatase
LIVQPEDAEEEDEKKVVLTVQPRIAASSLAFTELPAGMVNATKGFTGKAAEEIWEETRIKVEQSELFNMTEFALRDRESKVHVGESNVVNTAESLEKAMYPSPGGCDESITLYLCQKRLKGAHIKHLENLPTGLTTEGEKIRLKLVPLTELWREGARDAKALAALSLYENIKKDPKLLPPMPSDVDSESREWRTYIK